MKRHDDVPVRFRFLRSFDSREVDTSALFCENVLSGPFRRELTEQRDFRLSLEVGGRGLIHIRITAGCRRPRDGDSRLMKKKAYVK